MVVGSALADGVCESELVGLADRVSDPDADQEDDWDAVGVVVGSALADGV